MNNFKIGDKVRVLSNETNAMNDDITIFCKGDIGVISEVDGYGGVRISTQANSWIDIESLELVDEEKKVYTEDDLYGGMVLECVYRVSAWWTIGQKYVITKKLELLDDDGDNHDTRSVLEYLNDDNHILKFKVVEPEESKYVAEEYVSMPRLTGTNIEDPVMSSIPLDDNNMIVNQEHYTNNSIQPIEIMKANFTKEEYRGFLLGNIVKYPLRYKDKNGLRDLKTTYTYLTWLIKDIEERGL